jgi:hypothetical protein
MTPIEFKCSQCGTECRLFVMVPTTGVGMLAGPHVAPDPVKHCPNDEGITTYRGNPIRLEVRKDGNWVTFQTWP